MLFLGVVMMIAPAAALTADAIPVSDEYVLRTWEMDDGLPNNNVSGVAQTPDGYLWLATWGGLARFDGERFVVFSKDSTPGLASDRVKTVFAAGNGDLWLGLELGGVARKRGNGFEVIVPVQPRPASVAWVSSIAEDAEGAMWFGQASIARAVRWRSGEISEFSEKQGISPGVETQVQADRDGRIWFFTKRGCGFFDGTRFRPVDLEGGERPVLAPARAGGMWATRNQQLLRYRPDGSREVVADISWLGQLAAVSVLFEDGAGDLWIGTRNAGLFRFRGGSFARVPTSHTEISALAEDRDGNLWVGTEGGGLNRLRPSRFRLHQTSHGLPHDNVSSLCEDAEGRLWVVGRDGRPVRSLDDTNQSFATPPGWPGGQVLAMCPDPAGGIWMGTINAGLMRWKDGVFSHVSQWEKVTALMVDRSGDLWTATLRDNLIRRRGKDNNYIPVAGGLVAPRALAEDREGRLWAGTDEGLVFQRQADGHFVRVSLPDAKPGQVVQFIVPDEHDTVWIGLLHGGLYRWRSGEVAGLSPDAGLPADDLRSLLIDADDDFWFGTARGLYRVARSEVETSLSKGKRLAGVVAYDRDDGLANMEFSLGFRNATARTRDGHLWFATVRGALEITSQKRRAERPAPPVLIEEVRVGDAVASGAVPQLLELPPKPGPVEIRYTLSQLSAPQRVRFRYRLDGQGDSGWVSSGNQRLVTFAHLPPGHYRFEVQAAESDEAWLPSAALAFTVKAAWWETLWFQAGLELLGAVAVAAVVRLMLKRRMRARLRAVEQEHALEKERARIARDMHDQLGANLTEVALFAGLVHAESGLDGPAAAHATRVMASARKAVAALDEIVWAVNPRNDTLPRLLEYIGQCSADFLHAAGLRCRLDLPVDPPARPLAADFRHNLFLIVQEALNNAVKHAEAREVRLNIATDETALTMEIADDGRGLPEGDGRAGANGLDNLRERAAALGGTCVIESRPGCGTCLKFHLPWPHLRG